MNKQAKILGLDLGDRHTGVAVLDPAAPVALPLAAIQNNRSFLARLAALCRELGIGQIVIGLPLALTGTDTPQTQKVRLLAAKIGDTTGLATHLQDERFTTRQAISLTQHTRNLPAHHLDSVSAQLILQAWWNSQKP